MVTQPTWFEPAYDASRVVDELESGEYIIIIVYISIMSKGYDPQKWEG